MSRLSKWTFEKAKVKVVFRLQFHATHVPQAGWDKLFISFVPSDSGKATAKTTKAIVRNGTCKWGDPIYETTRLLLDSRSKLYDEKLYKFVVAMGSSRSSILGEASINLADYADALKPSIVALPLQGCSAGTILHVTVQLLTSKTGFREFEQQREVRERGLQTGVDINSRDGAERVSSSEDIVHSPTDKVHARVRLRPEPKELPSREEEAGWNEEYTNSPMGIDASSNTSGSLYAEKHDNSSVHEIDSLNYSVDNDLAISNEENVRLRGCLELAESSILELKHEVASLRNHAEEIGMATQKFSQQITAEISSSEELAEEISVMKLECSKLKGDLQQLLSQKSNPQSDNSYQGILLRWRRGLLVVEDKIKEIQRKVYLSLDDREARLIHLDFEALLTVLLELKQENSLSEIANSHKSDQYISGNGLDVDLFHPPDMLHCLSIPSVSPQGHDSLIATKAMEDKIFELLRELDGSKVEREGMIRKMNEMECYYEALVLELEENQKQMLLELQNLRSENSTCLYTVASTNAEIELIRQETNEQLLRFSEERHELDLICQELERRAITSEAALKRARLNYSIAVDQLQKDLDLLSFQVLSMHETNENLIRKTCTEGFQLHSQNMGKKKEGTGGDVLLEDMKNSLFFQEGLYHKVEEELSEMHVAHVHLDIFSKVLQESLLQASLDIVLMEKKIDELVQQFDLSTESKRLLTLQLQSAMSDMAHQNQILGLKSEGLSNENFLLAEKIAQLESLLRDCCTYKTEFEVCSAEKAELANLLTQEAVSKENLQKEMSSLYEKLELFECEQSDLARCNEHLQKLVNSLEEKLGNVLKTCTENFNGTASLENTVSRDIESLDLLNVVSQLEKIQFDVCGKTRQLLEEKKNLEDERDRAQEISSTASSELVIVKQKLEHELQNVGAKLEVSNSLVEKLQKELATLADKHHISLEVEEKYVKENRELLDKLEDLEGEMQHLTSVNTELDKEILGLTDELGRTKSTIDELTLEMRKLTMSLENKVADNAKLASELDSLKENLRFLHDELNQERRSKDDLEGAIDHLTSQLNEKNEQLFHFAQLEDELLHVRKRASDLELQIRILEEERDQAHVLSSSASSEVLAANKKLKHDMVNMAAKLESSNGLVEKFQSDLEKLVIKLHLSLEGEEKYGKQDKELLDNFSVLECGLQDLTSKNMELAEEISSLNIISEELRTCKLTVAELAQEKENLMISSQDKASENFRLKSELDSLREKVKFLHDELDAERCSRNELRGTIDHLMVELNNKNEELLCFSQQQAELVHFRQRASDLEQERKNLEDEREQAQAVSNSSNSEILVTKQKFKKAIQNTSAKLEASNSLVEKLELELESLANKLQTRSESEEQCEKQNKDLLANLSLLEGNLQDLTSKNTELAYNISCLNSVTEELECCKSTLVELTQERQDLTVSLQEKAAEIVKLESEIDYLKESSRSLHDEFHTERTSRENVHGTIEHITFQLNEKNERLLRFSQQEAEMAHFRQLASDLECEASDLHEYIISSDIKLIFLRSQYEIGIEEVALNFDSSDKQLEALEVKISEKLPIISEQEVDYLLSSGQEADILILFLKAKLKELIDQFAGENNNELSKLQRLCDELNNKLSQQVLKTEEFEKLYTQLKELNDKAEAESPKSREKRSPEGPSNAERESLRIAFIKEQYESRVQELRHQVSVSKKHAEDMLLKLQDSVNELETMKRSEAANMKRNEELSMKVLELEAQLQSAVSEKWEKIKAYDLMKGELECALLSLECCKEEKEKHEASLQECSQSNGLKERGAILDTDSTATSPELTDEHSIINGEIIEEKVKHPTVSTSAQSSQGVLVPANGHNIPKHEHASPGKDKLPHNGPEHFAVIDHRTKIQSLKSSMDHLQQELERMKNENSLLRHEDQHPDSSVQDLQAELLRLNEANEELRTRFPLFDELPGNGNALERVFALEVELAEALQAKKKSDALFQSSFLKQHGDEQAIFQSFRDINELIKEMLELKGKHASMERELHDMHDRYSQLSLQLAEVEGERQKLVMTLKNSRSPKKFTLLNRSTSATLE